MRYRRGRQLPRHDIPTPGSSGKAPRLTVTPMLATSGGRADLRFDHSPLLCLRFADVCSKDRYRQARRLHRHGRAAVSAP
jgi:hypothetical protein